MINSVHVVTNLIQNSQAAKSHLLIKQARVKICEIVVYSKVRTTLR